MAVVARGAFLECLLKGRLDCDDQWWRSAPKTELIDFFHEIGHIRSFIVGKFKAEVWGWNVPPPTCSSRLKNEEVVCGSSSTRSEDQRRKSATLILQIEIETNTNLARIEFVIQHG